VLYFALCYPLSLLGAWAERKLGRRRMAVGIPALQPSLDKVHI
jgi:hypothetical protein